MTALGPGVVGLAMLQCSKCCVWTLQSDKEVGSKVSSKASEDMVEVEDGVKGEGDIKEGDTEAADGEAKLDSEAMQNGSIEVKPDQDGEEEEGKKNAEDKEKGNEEVKQEEDKKVEMDKEPKEQLPEKPTLQLHGKHSSSGKSITFTDIACFYFARYMLHIA